MAGEERGDNIPASKGTEGRAQLSSIRKVGPLDALFYDVNRYVHNCNSEREDKIYNRR